MMPWKVPKASTVGCPISRTVTYYAVHLNNIISTFDWWLSTWLTQKQLKGNVVAGNRIRIKKMNSQFALMIRLNSKNISLEFGYIELVTKCYSSNEKFFFFFFIMRSNARRGAKNMHSLWISKSSCITEEKAKLIKRVDPPSLCEFGNFIKYKYLFS